MKTSTAYQISFANAFADLYLDKENGEVALDLRRQETTIYVNQTQYQALVLLLQSSLEDEEFIEYLNWQKDPLQCDENLIFEICWSGSYAALVVHWPKFVCERDLLAVMRGNEGLALPLLHFFQVPGLKIPVASDAASTTEFAGSLSPMGTLWF